MEHVQAHFLSQVEHVEAFLGYEKHFSEVGEYISCKIGWPILLSAIFSKVEKCLCFRVILHFCGLWVIKMPDIGRN